MRFIAKPPLIFLHSPDFAPCEIKYLIKFCITVKKDGKMRTAVSTSIKVFGAGWPQYASESDI